MVLPDGGIVFIEHAKKPASRDSRQALETFGKLVRMWRKVVAVVIIGERVFDVRDEGLIAQSLRSECLKYGAEAYLSRPGQRLHVMSMDFVVRR